ncbi:MAG: biopolymer transporter ExbD [Chitinophagaceae bacterium]|nr:biopolymer transporter ExbD [Chitinophagaceae bacterium]
MASIEEGGDSGHKKGPGVKKAKKLSTRVDMTPMVDLGFLLITFFVFTATMSTPTTLDLNMPKDVKDQKEQTEVKESSVLSLLLGKGDQIYYYEGKLAEDGSNFKSTGFKGIRDIIVKKKQEVISRYVPDPECEAKARAEGKPVSNCADKDFVVIIKPSAECTYKNTVDILDEMTINQVRTYAMVKIFPIEFELVKKTEEINGIK